MGTLQDLLNKGQCKTGLLGCTKPCRVGQAGANQLGAALQERPWDPGGTQHGQEAGGHPFSKATPTPPGCTIKGIIPRRTALVRQILVCSPQVWAPNRGKTLTYKNEKSGESP